MGVDDDFAYRCGRKLVGKRSTVGCEAYLDKYAVEVDATLLVGESVFDLDSDFFFAVADDLGGLH